MAQFDVYRNSGTYSKIVPFVVDIQNGILLNFNTRVVIPLKSSTFIKENNVDIIKTLNPLLSICDDKVILFYSKWLLYIFGNLEKKLILWLHQGTKLYQLLMFLPVVSELVGWPRVMDVYVRF